VHTFTLEVIKLFLYIKGSQTLSKSKALLSLTPRPKKDFSLDSFPKKANIPYGHT